MVIAVVNHFVGIAWSSLDNYEAEILRILIVEGVQV